MENKTDQKGGMKRLLLEVIKMFVTLVSSEHT